MLEDGVSGTGAERRNALYSVAMEDQAMSRKGQHVVPSSNGWTVRKAGATRASSVHATQQEAIDAATRIARNQRTELYIHGEDGRIRERNSYGNDPYPPKG